METIDITKTLYKVSDFLSWQRAGTLKLSPNFQRRPVWPSSAKSYFVDTVARGLPVPIIFLRERIDLTSLEPMREVVDGQQRIRTLLSFVDSTCLKDYNEARDSFRVKPSHNPELGNKEFAQLSVEIKRRILDYQFSTHILPSGTDDRLVLQIFARMNSTGVKLNGQELRNAQYFGLFKFSMYQISSEQLHRWRKWGILSELNIARMAEVEVTSDLVLLIMSGTFGMSQGVLDTAYKEYDDEFPHQQEVERRFRGTMDAIDDVFGNDMATSEFRTRLLFHPLFARFYDLLFGLGSGLERKPAARLPSGLREKLQILNERIRDGKVPEKVAIALSKRDNNTATRQARYSLFQSAV